MTTFLVRYVICGVSCVVCAIACGACLGVQPEAPRDSLVVETNGFILPRISDGPYSSLVRTVCNPSESWQSQLAARDALRATVDPMVIVPLYESLNVLHMDNFLGSDEDNHELGRLSREKVLTVLRLALWKRLVRSCGSAESRSQILVQLWDRPASRHARRLLFEALIANWNEAVRVLMVKIYRSPEGAGQQMIESEELRNSSAQALLERGTAEDARAIIDDAWIRRAKILDDQLVGVVMDSKYASKDTIARALVAKYAQAVVAGERDTLYQAAGFRIEHAFEVRPARTVRSADPQARQAEVATQLTALSSWVSQAAGEAASLGEAEATRRRLP